ncbi:MAG: DUF6580 family putative transport protein [Planctomycetota bacterium]
MHRPPIEKPPLATSARGWLTRRLAADAAVFCLLVAIGVVGRWGQPMWAFTPLAAIGVFAGAYFRHAGAAVFVPLLAMLISDAGLQSYDHAGVLLTVYGALAFPVLLGRWFRAGGPAGSDRAGWVATIGKLAASAIAPAVCFFLLTNFAVWLLRSDYPATLAGLGECYANALPFFRQRLAGDLLYVPLLVLPLLCGQAGSTARTKPAVAHAGR